jgi:hypothetical protein
VAVGHSVEAAGWAAEVDRLLDRMAGRFPRVETRRRAGQFVLGLLADLPRKNCWAIAEHAGDRDPHGMQHLLARASWDTDGARNDLRDYVIGALGDPDGVLVVDLCRRSDYADLGRVGAGQQGRVDQSGRHNPGTGRLFLPGAGRGGIPDRVRRGARDRSTVDSAHPIYLRRSDGPREVVPKRAAGSQPAPRPPLVIGLAPAFLGAPGLCRHVQARQRCEQHRWPPHRHNPEVGIM